MPLHHYLSERGRQRLAQELAHIAKADGSQELDRHQLVSVFYTAHYVLVRLWRSPLLSAETQAASLVARQLTSPRVEPDWHDAQARALQIGPVVLRILDELAAAGYQPEA